MRKLTAQETAIATEIANYVALTADVVVVLWVARNELRGLFSHSISNLLDREYEIPGGRRVEDKWRPKITRKNQGEITLEHHSRVYIYPVSSVPRGLSINRAYIPKQLPERQKELDHLLSCILPTMVASSTVVRYEAGLTDVAHTVYLPQAMDRQLTTIAHDTSLTKGELISVLIQEALDLRSKGKTPDIKKEVLSLPKPKYYGQSAQVSAVKKAIVGEPLADDDIAALEELLSELRNSIERSTDYSW